MTEMFGGPPDFRDLDIIAEIAITRPTAREIRLALPPAAAGLPAPPRFTRHHTERLSRRALAQYSATRATAGRPRPLCHPALARAAIANSLVRSGAPVRLFWCSPPRTRPCVRDRIRSRLHCHSFFLRVVGERQPYPAVDLGFVGRVGVFERLRDASQLGYEVHDLLFSHVPAEHAGKNRNPES